MVMGLGRIVYVVYYRPLASIRKLLKTGIRKTIQQDNGRRAMFKIAYTLKEIHYPGKETLEVYFLSGKKYWYQTAFCLYSLQKESRINIHAFIVDDGSFDDGLENQVRTQFPSVTIVRQQKILELLDELLPENKFPVLRKRRLEYPHLRKLTDIHVLSGDRPKLVLDSDMLFFKKPVSLLNWLRHPDSFLFMKDVENSYGYSVSLMKELAACENFPDKLNVGVAGIHSKQIDWNKLEYWTAELSKREGSSYLQEQAITAMMAANQKYVFLDEKEYKVLPVISNGIDEVLHHYVAGSKYDYFVKAWKNVVAGQ
jgi:hypothetical protein